MLYEVITNAVGGNVAKALPLLGNVFEYARGKRIPVDPSLINGNKQLIANLQQIKNKSSIGPVSISPHVIMGKESAEWRKQTQSVSPGSNPYLLIGINIDPFNIITFFSYNFV